MKAMNDARKTYIHLEANERLKRAVKKKTRTQISAEPFVLNSRVLFRRNNIWKGPGIVIGIDNKTVIVKQGGQMYRVPPCECKHLNDPQEPLQEGCDVKNPVVETSVARTRSQIKEVNRAVVLEEEIEPDDSILVDLETTNDIRDTAEVCRTDVNHGPSTSDHETEEQPIQNNVVIENGCDVPPPMKCLVRYKLKDKEDWNVVRIIKRGGKAVGKYKHWYNVYDRDTDDTQIYSLNWQSVDTWNVVPEEVLMSVKAFSDPDVLEAKMTEMESWKRFEVYDEIKNEGQRYITVQWVVTQKFNEKGRSVKARLVARGFQEPNEHIKKDSPTTTRESVRVLLCMAISHHGWVIHSLDVKSAFLQGDLLKREVFLKPPKEANTNALRRLNKCVYGLTDASRRWYLRVDSVFKSLNMECIVLDEAVYIWRDQGSVEGIICIHVDDFIWTGSDRFKLLVIEKIWDEFYISTQDHGSFKYLGLQIDQSQGRILVDQKHYVESIEKLGIECVNRKRDESLTLNEKVQLKAFVGKLAWAANLTHPEIAFDTCEASVGNKLSTVSDAFKANKTLRKLKNNDFCIKFVPLSDLSKCKLVVYCDASYANLKGDASQSGYVIFLVDGSGNANVLKWQSKKISRVVKSTLAAETLALLDAAETGYYLKRLIESFLGVSNGTIEVRCFTDNKSIVDHVFKSTNKVADFRLRVDIACLRDMIRRQEISHIHWIDTASQLADCLTKADCSSKNLSTVLTSNLMSSNIMAKCRLPKYEADGLVSK